MNDMIEWLVHLPQYFAQFGDWLVTPVGIGDLTISPIAMFGSGALVFVGVIIALKIKSLIFV